MTTLPILPLDLKVVDVSGYSFTGKSAVYDLLREFEGYYSQSKEFEFDLIRVQGGLLDLQSALTTHWSPIRSSEAIRNFMRLITLFGGDRSLYSRLTTTGAHYDHFLPGFTVVSKRFIESLVSARWKCDWPFASYSHDQWTVTIHKILARMGWMSQPEVFLARMKEEDFTLKVQNYLHELFHGVASLGYKSLILNNAFEPFYPERSIGLIKNAKSIVVDRDPRDVYISAMSAGKIAGSLVGLAVTGDGVDKFIQRFRLYRMAAFQPSENVYRINFESLILNYQHEVAKIREFLGESEFLYEKQGSIFHHKSSVNNIALWRKEMYSHLLPDIRIIETQLAEFCLDI
jgi:Sulfotransferase family